MAERRLLNDRFYRVTNTCSEDITLEIETLDGRRIEDVFRAGETVDWVTNTAVSFLLAQRFGCFFRVEEMKKPLWTKEGF